MWLCLQATGWEARVASVPPPYGVVGGVEQIQGRRFQTRRAVSGSCGTPESHEYAETTGSGSRAKGRRSAMGAGIALRPGNAGGVKAPTW